MLTKLLATDALAGFAQSLRANPRDPATWGVLGDELNGDHRWLWEHEPSNVCECGHTVGTHHNMHFAEVCCLGCSCPSLRVVPLHSLPGHLQPPFAAWLTGRLVELEDERRHGVRPCKRLCPRCGNSRHGQKIGHCDCWEGPCHDCHDTLEVPTFALLFDHPGPETCYCKGSVAMCPICSGTGNALVRGHLGELADWLRHAGDPRAEAVGRIGVRQSAVHGALYWVWYDGDLFTGCSSYADACREAILRVVGLLTAECPECGGKGTINTGPGDYGDEYVPCRVCFRLGWTVRLVDAAKEVAR